MRQRLRVRCGRLPSLCLCTEGVASRWRNSVQGASKYVRRAQILQSPFKSVQYSHDGQAKDRFGPDIAAYKACRFRERDCDHDRESILKGWKER